MTIGNHVKAIALLPVMVTKEYERLRGELQQSFEASSLPEVPRGAEALHALLVRLRLAKHAKE